ncbi:chromosome partitioning protein ParA [Vibrio aestuarianus]|uniref:chromosome partitioning protein ParA n=1 Tax=Vibrio aestuarianus TaxID=28171 RepID=UPI00237CFE18|nr:chromosome partitioning protein ParA [Vibrio aestuarianus]MDE1315683.1 chromosome partitioning protein ParA [Vibrio aestuarianus]
MSIGTVNEFFHLVGSFSFGTVLGAGLIYFFVKSYLPAYFSSKAKNLATKEDIGAITHEVELVKHGYSSLLEEVKSNHQLKLAAIEREKLLKKEVYLESFEALSKYQNILAVLSNLEVPNQVLTDSFSSSAAQVSKVTLVGSEATVKSLTIFMGEVAAAYMSLLLDRGNLVIRKNHIDFLETYRKKHIDEIERCLTIMQNMNLEGVTDQGAWERVNRSFESQCEARDKVASEIEENLVIQNHEHSKFGQRCMDEFFRVNDLAPHLLLSIRAELDLDLDETEYLKIHAENTRKGKAVFENFMESLSKIA